MERILLIEDNMEISELLSDSLRRAGYSCTQAFSGTEGLFFAERDPFSLAILDIGMTGLDLKSIVARIRRSQDIPIIAVSIAQNSRHQVHILPAGASETKGDPIVVKELTDRVGAQIRLFSSRKEPKVQFYQYQELTLDTVSYQAAVKGKEIPLTKQEFKILELLVSNPDRIFTKREIYDYAWDDLYLGEDKTINVHISNIRRKLKEVTNRPYIRTIWGTGFQLAK